jgi:F-type H+-transporting ATPase subunit delta
MEESAITMRYARALFLLAKEKNQLTALKQDTELISEVCRMSAEFVRLLKDPVIKTSKKIRLMKIIFEGKISLLSQNFLVLVTRNKRETFIPAICRNTLSLIRSDKHIKTVVLTTAQSIDNETLEKAKKVLEKELGTRVELTCRVNPNIIGGIVLRIDDKQYDDSLATRLRKMKQSILKSHM